MCPNRNDIIPLDSEMLRFDEHISNDFNKRIVFSGAFGSGKTFFINNFFEDRNDEFILFKLYPINYSVTLNEDIFELIKYDILLNLLKTYGDNIEIDENISKLLSIQFYALNESYAVAKPIIEAIPKIGKNIASFIEVLSKFSEKFKEYDRKTRTINSNQIEQLIKDIQKQKGSIYEEDAITILIRDLIKQIKERNIDKKIALIIEDLDRIDPEHIFRLLNVFAAHFDIYNEDLNKFDFDKIIFVCDIENIRNIFHSKYGTEVDFTGYIDKFYSTDVFKFDNAQEIDNFISSKLLTKFKLAGKNEYFNLERDSDVVVSINYILKILIQSNIINLRSLLKPILKGYTVHLNQIRIRGIAHSISNYSFEAMILLEYLKYLFGTLENLKIAIKKCKLRKEYEIISDKKDSNDLRKYSVLVTLLYYERIYAESNRNGYTISIYHSNCGKNFACSIEKSDRNIKIHVNNIEQPAISDKNIKYKLNYFELLFETIEYVQEMGYIK